MLHYCYQNKNSPLYIQEMALATSQCLDNLGSDPQYRKATTNMKLASWALDQIANGQADRPFGVSSQKIGLYLGTSHGELAATQAFLKHLACEKRVRPLFFQNSLHHSTIGHLSQKYNIQGPGITVSQKQLSGEWAFFLASQDLHQGKIEKAIVLGVDSSEKELGDILAKFYPPSYQLKSGCGCLILGKSPSDNCVRIDSLEIKKAKSTKPQDGGYDSDFIEKLIHSLMEAPRGKQDICFERHTFDGYRTRLNLGVPPNARPI